MSRKSIKEYILRQQEDYIGEPDRRRRSRMLCKADNPRKRVLLEGMRGR